VDQPTALAVYANGRRQVVKGVLCVDLLEEAADGVGDVGIAGLVGREQGERTHATVRIVVVLGRRLVVFFRRRCSWCGLVNAVGGRDEGAVITMAKSVLWDRCRCSP
jgi:hypothetical protein